MKNDILDDFSPFSNPLKQELQKHLHKRERLLWVERPKQGILFRASDGCLIPFSLVWGGFAIFWEISVFVLDAPLFMALFGVPFVLVGLYLIVGRFFYDRYLRKKTLYGLTDKRIIVKQKDKLRSLDLSSLTDVQITKKKDGSGSIAFSDKYNPFNNFYTQNESDADSSSYSFVQFNTDSPQRGNTFNPSNFSFTKLDKTLSFDMIPKVQVVYDQIGALRHL